jgi:putative ABC transport system permease protein
MPTLWQDLRYALRMLAKSPGFTIIAVLTLALGIGANTAIFSVVDAVILKPLPFRQPGQLVDVRDDLPGMNLQDVGMSQPELEDFQQRSRVFDQISAIWPIDANITGAEKPERVEALAVSFNYFELLGARPALGRLIGPQDFQPGFTEAAVISDAIWHRMFGADPAVLGRPIRLDSDLYRIVGVLPPDFRHPGVTLEHDEDVWVACGFAANPFPAPPLRQARFLPGAIARLKPGVTLPQAQSQLDAFVAHLREQYPDVYPAAARWQTRLVPLQKSIVGSAGTMLFILLGSVGLVLLIACVNIASLLLARSSGRYREIAVRRALGAGRARLIRQTLTESVLLSLFGGLLALVLSTWFTSLLLRLVPSRLPRVAEVSADARVFFFALGVSLLTGLLFGLAPAAQLSDPQIMDNLKEGARGGSVGARQHRFLSVLVVSELALSLVLLVGAGLLLRSFWNLLQVQPGFNPSHLVTARVWLSLPNDPKDDPYLSNEKRSAFVREVLRRVDALPGVQQAAIGSGSMPLSPQFVRRAFPIEGRPTAPAEMPIAYFSSVTPEYFSVLETPLMRGRLFTSADNETGAPVALIDQTAAELYWPHDDPIGRRIQVRDFGRDLTPRMATIVGIVGKTRSNGLDAPYAPQVFISAYQSAGYAVYVFLRSSASPEALEEPLRREIEAVDSTLPVFSVRTLDSVVADSLAERRFTMQMLGFFAATALLLAAIGIYGVMAYFVEQRGREIGIRIALGAQPWDVLRLVLGRGLLLTGVGVAIGIVGAAALTRSLATLVFNIAPLDPLTFAAGAALLAAVALAGSYVPARRAMRVDPVVALRHE